MFSILIAIFTLIIVDLLPVLPVFANVNTDKYITCREFTKVNKTKGFTRLNVVTNVK